MESDSYLLYPLDEVRLHTYRQDMPSRGSSASRELVVLVKENAHEWYATEYSGELLTDEGVLYSREFEEAVGSAAVTPPMQVVKRLYDVYRATNA